MATLRDLGLSEYEASVYRALLDAAPATAKAVAAAGDVPMGRVYDVLGSLETKGLVRCQDATRPKRYVPVEPAAALDRLLADRKRELRETAERYEASVETLKRELDAPERAERFWTAAVGPEESVDLLTERIDAAEHRVTAVATLPGAGFDVAAAGSRIADCLAAAADRGVQVRVLAAAELYDRAPAELVERYAALADAEGPAIRLSEEVEGTFTLVDDAEACIEVPHPLDEAEPFALIDLRDADFAAEVREAFEPRWAAATPLPA